MVNFAEWSPFVASIKKTEDSGIPAEQRPDLDAWVNACAPLMNNAQPSFEDWVIIFPQLMIMHPKAVMKKIGGPAKFTERIKGALRLFLRKLCEAQNPCVLNALVRLWFALTYAAKRHIADETELLEYAKEVASITSELCKCHALYNKGAAYRLLLPKQYWPSNTAASPDNDSKESTSDEEDKNEEARRANHEALWCAMHVFRADGPIKLCMDCGFKQVLASAMVVDMMRYLFYNGIDFGDK